MLNSSPNPMRMKTPVLEWSLMKKASYTFPISGVNSGW
jgi:hypothetical protein